MPSRYTVYPVCNTVVSGFLVPNCILHTAITHVRVLGSRFLHEFWWCIVCETPWSQYSTRACIWLQCAIAGLAITKWLYNIISQGTYLPQISVLLNSWLLVIVYTTHFHWSLNFCRQYFPRWLLIGKNHFEAIWIEDSSSAESLEALPLLSCKHVGATLPRAPESSWGDKGFIGYRGKNIRSPCSPLRELNFSSGSRPITMDNGEWISYSPWFGRLLEYNYSASAS